MKEKLNAPFCARQDNWWRQGVPRSLGVKQLQRVAGAHAEGTEGCEQHPQDGNAP